MAFNLASIQKGPVAAPPRILVHGGEGIGKTTLAANAPKPIFIFTEKGQGRLSLDAFPIARSWADIKDAISSLLSEEHEYETVVVDSVDWLERLIFTAVCEEQGKGSIEEFGFGKGYAFALDYWAEFLAALDELNEARGMAVILIGHSVLKTVNNPDGDNYDQAQLDVHKDAMATLKQWTDAVLYAALDIRVRKDDKDKNAKVGKGVKGHNPERVLYTEERPAYWAKNRYGLPHQLALDWAVLQDAIGEGLAAVEQTVRELKEETATTAGEAAAE